MTRDTLKLVHYLLNFETSTTKLLQVLLVGQEELAAKIIRYKELASRMFPITINALSGEYLARRRFRPTLASLVDSIRLFGRSNPDGDGLPTRRALFGVKIALSRLAQIVRYASGIEVLDYDLGADELKDHYDPELIDKARVIALINILRVQLGDVQDEGIRDRLLDRVARLEREVQRTRPRWGRIIAGFFIILGFVADLKTISPRTYDALHRTVEAIVETLQTEGSVEHHRRRPELPAGEERPLAILPGATVIREDDEAEKS